LLACGIGLPTTAPVAEGDVNGLRLGVPEIVRRGMAPANMGELGGLIARALGDGDPGALAEEVTAFRRTFSGLHFVRK